MRKKAPNYRRRMFSPCVGQKLAFANSESSRPRRPSVWWREFTFGFCVITGDPNPIMASFHTAHRSDRVRLRADFGSNSSPSDRSLQTGPCAHHRTEKKAFELPIIPGPIGNRKWPPDRPVPPNSSGLADRMWATLESGKLFNV